MTMLDESGEEKLREDAKTMETLLKEITQGAKAARSCVKNLIEHAKSKPEAEGISFLDMKNRLLTSYSSNLGLLMLRKCYGLELEGEQAVDRLVEIRTVLEKVRPIDQKLRYQIDKLVNVAEKGKLDANDPLRFKPNPSGLMSKVEEDDEEGDEEGDNAGNKGAIYKPAKNVPQFFESSENKEEVLEARKKKYQISKSIMESIREQYTDIPEEQSQKADIIKQKFIREDREKTTMEEDNYFRFPETKADKANKRKNALYTMKSIGDDVVSLGVNYYDGQGQPGEPQRKKSKKNKGGGKPKGKKSKKFKKRQ